MLETHTMKVKHAEVPMARCVYGTICSNENDSYSSCLIVMLFEVDTVGCSYNNASRLGAEPSAVG